MSYSYDIGGLDLFADPFRSPQIQRTQVSRQQTKTSVMQPKAQATSMQQPKNKTSAVPQTEKTQPRATQSTNTQKPNISDKPVVEEKSPDTEAKVSAPQAEAVNVTAQTEKPQAEKQPPVDTHTETPKKELVLDMSTNTAISDNPPAVSDDARRKAHEAAEAKRKAEWEEKQLAKKKSEEDTVKKIQSMNDDDVVSASTERISADVERITRRNMKECVSDHIQDICRKNPAFARLTMHPRKSMANCFKYINRMAKDFILQEMEENGIQKDSGGYGSDVPDGLCYQWAVDYFNATDAPEDQKKEEKFVPKPYVGGSSKSVSKTKKAKNPDKTPKKETDKQQEPSTGYEQMTLGV